MIDINNIFNKNLTDINWEYINTIPEFNILNNTQQNILWHKEGNVMTHTKMVCEAMKKLLIANNITDEYKIKYMMLAALFHDIGKGTTTKLEDDGLYHCKNHGSAGEKITRALLWDIDFNLREKICSLVSEHMKPLYFIDKDNPVRCIIEISLKCNIDELCLLKTADCMGAINDDNDWRTKISLFKEKAIELNCYDKPYAFVNENCKFKYFHNIDMEYPPMYDYDFTEFNVVIMCGLPGAGKDTFIKQHYSELLPIICRDDIRKEIGLKGEKPMGNKKEESKVTKISEDRIKKYCKDKVSFIINNTSLRKQHRENLINLIKPYNPNIIIVYIEAPTISDNLKRRNGQINENVILNMQKTMDFPKITESHDLVIIKQ